MKKNVQRAVTPRPDRQFMNAATIYVNPEYDPETNTLKGEEVGATTGSVTFNSAVEYRNREYNGFIGFDYAGGKVIQSAEVTATASVTQLTDAIIQKWIKADIEYKDGKKVLKPRQSIEPGDFIESVGIFNWLPNGDWMMIKMYNVLITSDFSIETAHDEDFSGELELRAHLDWTSNHGELPYEIVTPDVFTPDEHEMQAVITNDNGEDE